MSTGLYSGVSGLAIGSGLWKAFPGLWSGAAGLIDLPQTLSLDFLGGAPLDSRITFSRGSQATLTDSTGKITYAPNNLLTNSEDFESANWVKSGAGTGTAPVITPNFAVAPNGTTTADRVALVNSGTTLSDWSWVYQNLTPAVANATYIFSVWVKAATPSDVGKTIIISAVSTPVATLTADWQRVFAIGTTVGTTTISFGVRIRGVEVPTTSATLFLWGAQAELVTYQTTPGTYNSTTPKNLLGYTQEFDNAAWTKSNAFVQTNLLTYSQDFNNAAWGAGSITVTANVAAAPDGTSTADLIVPTTANTYHYVSQNTTFAASTTYTRSVYAKPAGYNWLLIQTRTLDNVFRYAYFNVATGAVGASSGVTSASATAVGNGWYRCSIVFASGTGAAADNMSYQCCPADNSSLFAGDGTSGMYLWGAQLVQGATAGNYQPTYAAAAAVQYAAPDGTLSADKLVETTAAGTHIAFQVATFASSTPYVISCYAKAGEITSFNLFNNVTTTGGVTAFDAVFDLSSGTVVSVANGGVATIMLVGNGWYRCSVANFVLTGTSANTQIRLVKGGNTSYTGDGTSGIYIWGAQLSNSASLDPYVYNPGAAPTSAAYYGPRFDYDPVTLAAKGLLIEEQRTNLLTYSEQFDNAAWVKTNATVTANSILSPDGTADADTITASAGAGYHYVDQRPAATAGVTYTASMYVKAGTTRYIGFGDAGDAVWHSAYLDTTNGAIISPTNCTATAVSVGNGWFRVTSTFTRTNAGSLQIYVGGSTATGTAGPQFTAVGTETCYAYGAQLEAGSFATSYIPTVASQVTRTADVALMQGANFSNWYNQNEGTFVIEADSATTGYRTNLQVDDGTLNNRILIQTNNVATAQQYYVVVGGSAVVNTSAQSFNPNGSKTSAAYKLNDYAYSVNGAAPTADTSATVPAVSRMFLGTEVSSNYLNGHISRISYYNTRLANTTLQALTA